MHFQKRVLADGTSTYRVFENYIDPLTGKRKRASVSFKSNSQRGKAQAARELDEKIEELTSQRAQALDKRVQKWTFKDLREDWFDLWKQSVKPMTIKREALVIRRLNQIIADDILVKNITPMLVNKCLQDYREKYSASFATMQHIKSTFNKLFDHAVLYNIIPASPTAVLHLKATTTEKIERKDRLESKFLDSREVKVLFTELAQRRNPAYYDLALFMIATGCRIGEASGLTSDKIDFAKKTVTISSSMQSHDLRVDEYYEDTVKTVAGERVEQLPDFAIAALKRAIHRNAVFDRRMKELPSDAFHEFQVIFRTEYGSPITSHSFREVLGRIKADLEKNCEKRYGFKWTKNPVPHSFRHIHISVLRDDSSVTLKEVQERVGHVEERTTDGYTHRLSHSQEKSVEVIDTFARKVGISLQPV